MAHQYSIVMKHRASALLSLLLSVSTSAFAVTVGHVTTGASAFFGPGGGVITSIGTAYPAPEAGTVQTVSLLWSLAPAGGCPNVFRVKFLRMTHPFGFTVVASRGPYTAVNGVNTVTLSPVVSINAGDMIGITQLYNCGGVAHAGADENILHFTTLSDPAGAVTGLSMARGLILAARASTAAETVAGYLPVVTGGPGAAGTSQRTGLQLSNMNTSWISGRIVFHPMFATAGGGDPSLPYSLAPGSTLSSDDILSLMGVTTSGTLDVLVSSGPAPRAEARIYKDTGPGTGTWGDYEELQHPQSVFGYFDSATIIVPSDLTNFTFNIGIRTFASGTTLRIQATTASGGLAVPLFTKTWGPNYTEQISASTFLNGASVPAGGVIYINVTAGSAMLYGITGDLLTGDANIRSFTRK